MSAPSLPERVQTLEDEAQALESMIDSRTRRLWAEIETLRTIVKELQGRGSREESRV